MSHRFRTSPYGAAHAAGIRIALASWSRIGLGVLAPLVGGCSDRAPEFRVIDITPAPGSGPLELNEPMTIRFTDTVDPSSVSGNAIQVKGPRGEPAVGRLVASGDHVTFVPRPASRADLGDAGYAPGEALEVMLRAFPSRDGVLSAAGDPLRETFRAEFRTAGADAEPFVDLAPGERPRLANLAALLSRPDGAVPVVRPDGVVRLVFSKPLAPRTVNGSAIEIRYDNTDRDRVEAEIRLEQGESDCSVLVRPSEGFQRDTRYLLVLVPQALRDFGGNPLDDVHPLPLACRADGSQVVGVAGTKP